MKLAVISDIHSNARALSRVLKDIESENPDHLIILGDTFGYYPWAVETWNLLLPWTAKMSAICGNHDLLALSNITPDPVPSYFKVAQQNYSDLLAGAPEGARWLHSLRPEAEIELAGKKLRLVHGTPEDPVNGRLYPDFKGNPSWFPCRGEMLLFGHTHYPMIRRLSDDSLILNPGSVGQPRDGDPRSSWAVLDLGTGEVQFRRTDYNHLDVMAELEELSWEPRFILALNKSRPGALNAG